MSQQEKLKRKSDKLTKQSFALLQRIKSKRQKVNAIPNQQNYIEDLYFKLFNKCSAHFDKMDTSNEILLQFKTQSKEKVQLEENLQELKAQHEKIRAQLAKLKESKDESSKVKALNNELNKLEIEQNENILLIKSLKKQVKELSNQLQQEQQTNRAAAETNAQLQSFVEKLSKELEVFESQQDNEKDESELLELKEEISKVKREAMSHVNTITFLTDQNNQLKSQLARTFSEIHRQQEELFQSKEGQTKLKEQLISYEQELLNLQKLLKENSSEFSTLIAMQKESTKIVTEKCNSLEGKLTQLEGNNKILKTEINSLLEVKKEQQCTIIQYQEDIAIMIAQIQHHTIQITSLKQQLAKKTNENFTLQSLLTNSEKTNIKLIQQNQQNEQLQLNSYTQFATIKEELQNKIDELKQRIKFFKKNNEDLNNERVDLIANVELLAEQTRALSCIIQEKDSQFEKLRKEKEYEVKVAVVAKEDQLFAYWRQKQRQYEIKLDETVQYHENRAQDKENEFNKSKGVLQMDIITQANQINEYKNQILLLKTQIAQWSLEKNEMVIKFQQLQSQRDDKIKFIQQLENTRQEMQATHNLILQGKLDETKKLNQMIEQLKERLQINKEQRDYLNQERAHSMEQNEKLENQTKKSQLQIIGLKQQINLSKTKILQLQQYLKKTEQTVKKKFQQISQADEFFECDQTQNKDEVPTQSKNNKYIQTINQLSGELTEAYKVIQELQLTVSNSKIEEKSENRRSSVDKKERGKSMKKLAGIFGF